MSRRSWIGPIAATVAVVTFAPIATASQDQPGPREVPVALNPRPTAPKTFDLEFRGGTVQEYVEALQTAAGERSIVLMPGWEPFRMPAVRLQGVTLPAAVRVLESLRIDDGSTAGRVRLAWNEGAITVMPEVESLKKAERISSVWSVAALVEAGVRAEDILSAVEAALSMVEAPVDIKFHQPTRLLMARGPISQMNTVEQVLSRLEAGVRFHNAAGDDTSRKTIEDLRAQVEAQAARVQQAEARAASHQSAQILAEKRAKELEARLTEQERATALRQAELMVRLEDAQTRAKRYEDAWLELERRKLKQEIELEQRGVKPKDP